MMICCGRAVKRRVILGESVGMMKALTVKVETVTLTGRGMICCGMAVCRMGMLGVSVGKMKALTVTVETVTLTGKGRSNLTCFVY
jgi:hypothetical protein